MGSESTGASVLIIDDDVALTRLFVRAASRRGYRARAANSATEALGELANDPPDVIVLDFRMPFINGVGFLYRLRDQAPYRQTPVLLVTGDALNEETRQELDTLGATVQMKPVGSRELIEAIDQLLGPDKAPPPAPSE